MFTRPIALSFVVFTGCASAIAPMPRALPPDIDIGAVNHRTRFEGDRTTTSPTTGRDAPDDRVETDRQRRRRKALFATGVIFAGLGTAGSVGFGLGGRITRGQLTQGYEDNTLTREEADTITRTGDWMNGLAIGSVSIGLAGIIFAAAVYGVDYARCGDLPSPRRCRPPAQSGEHSDR